MAQHRLCDIAGALVHWAPHGATLPLEAGGDLGGGPRLPLSYWLLSCCLLVSR